MTLSKKQERLARRLSYPMKESQWEDWRWQLGHAIRDIGTFEKLLEVRFPSEQKKELEQTIDKFPLSITPYYLSLIGTEDLFNDPIFKQAFPSPSEIQLHKPEMKDPLDEDKDSPVPGLIHRYPDRVLFLISNTCAIYCRHCTRKRRVGDTDFILDKASILKGIDYIQKTPAIRDVLLSGGDPLLLSDEYLEWILKRIRAINHVDIIRIGTRIPVVLPYRITDNLIKMMKKYQPLWINTHFNHPREFTQSSKEAVRKLADGGFPLGNQTVLLAGLNDCPRVMKALMHKLVKNRIRPYYLFQCDLAEGLAHFRTPVGKGIEIMESLIGHTSGLAVPTYVIDAPGGGGKIPVMPNYLISWSTNKVILRNYEGVITTYQEPDSYQSVICDKNCICSKQHFKLDEADEQKSIGIEKLLANSNSTISLTPANNERHQRRNKDSQRRTSAKNKNRRNKPI